MDLNDLKATLVSLLPFPIAEKKIGVYPSDYNIAASTDGKPRMLVIEDSFHYIYLGEDRGHMKIKIPAYELAAAIVYDYSNSLSCINTDAMPALFWVPGMYTDPNEIELNFADRVRAALALQTNWFLKLVKLADDDWQKYHRHSVISSHQLYACKALGLQREWLVVTREINVLCPACKSSIHPAATICPQCRTEITVQTVNS